jgi:hypothetical protein
MRSADRSAAVILLLFSDCLTKSAADSELIRAVEGEGLSRDRERALAEGQKVTDALAPSD